MPVALRSRWRSWGAWAAAIKIFLNAFTESLHPSPSRFLASDSEVRAGILNSSRREKGRACAPVMPVAPRSRKVR